MIDLHIHTKYSDGTDEVLDILKKAENNHLDYISITDHNNCNAYDELEQINIKDYYNGKIITGIEMNTKILGIPIEILGYGCNIKNINDKVKEMYLTPKERNIIEFERLIEKCNDIGIELPKDTKQNYDGSIFTSKYLHNLITQFPQNSKFIDTEAWNNSNIFYRKYMSNPNTKLFVNVDDIVPSFEEACNAIKEAGGYIFIPHIYEYKENSIKILEEILSKKLIDGIECYYTTFNDKQSQYLLNICKENNLFVSGGSDYHGNNKPDVEMGKGKGNLKISNDIINQWIDSIKYIY